MTPIGIIGCGGHAQHHAKHYIENFLTYGVWDPDPEAMKQISSKVSYDTLEALLAEETIVAVMICSPDEYHLEQIEKALAAGKHVFCEKPLLVPGQDMARLEAAFNLAENKKLAMTSCHPRRFDKPFWWLKSEVLTHPNEFHMNFGKVISIAFDFSYHKPSNKWKNARSLLLDHLSHEVDLMNFLFGIQGFEAIKLFNNFDRYEVAGKRDDGITFHFMGTRRLDSSKYPEWCSVRFERGEVRLDMLMGVAYIVDHEKGAITTVPKLEIDYEGRLKKVMANFGDIQIDWDQIGYLSRSEMLMNTEAGILLQNEGVQRINVRP